MKKQTVIHVDNVSKTFLVPHEKRNSIKEHFVSLFQQMNYSKFHALKNVSFDIKEGEFIGIIGNNGSGKSTLLKLLANIYHPTSGKVKVVGHVSPFLELGVGFNLELSARENVYMNGVVLGLTKEQIEARFDSIIEFAGLEEFVDTKLKNYSSGMYARLAFSVAVQVDADIIIMDEVLAVGDLNFQEKCFSVFRRLHKEGKTIILVTHSMGYVEEFCDKVILLDKGEVKGIGTPQKMISQYHKINMGIAEAELKEESEKKVEEVQEAEEPVEQFEAKVLKKKKSSKVNIIDVEFLDSKGRNRHVFDHGETITARIHIQATEEIEKPVIGVAIHSENQTHITGPNTKTSHFKIKKVTPKTQYVDYIIKKCPLIDDTYYFTAAIFNWDCTVPFDLIDKEFSFKISSALNNKFGFIKLNENWKIK